MRGFKGHRSNLLDILRPIKNKKIKLNTENLMKQINQEKYLYQMVLKSEHLNNELIILELPWSNSLTSNQGVSLR